MGKGGVCGIIGKEEGNAHYGGMVQPVGNMLHHVSCLTRVEWGLNKRGLRIVAAFWAGIPVSTLYSLEFTVYYR